MPEIGFDPRVRKNPLEKEMATHSNFIAQEILWTEEPGEATVQEIPRKQLSTHTHT